MSTWINSKKGAFLLIMMSVVNIVINIYLGAVKYMYCTFEVCSAMFRKSVNLYVLLCFINQKNYVTYTNQHAQVNTHKSTRTRQHTRYITTHNYNHRDVFIFFNWRVIIQMSHIIITSYLHPNNNKMISDTFL